MGVVWFLLLRSSTIYSQHTTHDVAEHCSKNAGAQVFATFLHQLDTYLFRNRISARFLFCDALQSEPVYWNTIGGAGDGWSVFAAVSRWRQYLCVRFVSFWVFMVPNGSLVASITDDGARYMRFRDNSFASVFYTLEFPAQKKLTCDSTACLRSI